MIDLLVALLGRRYCPACCRRLDVRAGIDLTGNRRAARYYCPWCGTVTEVTVPAPGGVVVPGV